MDVLKQMFRDRLISTKGNFDHRIRLLLTFSCGDILKERLINLNPNILRPKTLNNVTENNKKYADLIVADSHDIVLEKWPNELCWTQFK